MSNQPAIVFPRIKLSLLHKLINVVMARLFKAYGCDITREQEVILRELRQRDGVNQIGLTSRVGQDRNNLSRTLDILQSKKLVVRDVCNSDRRSSLVYITDEGRALHKAAYQAIQEYRKILFRGFSQEEVDAFGDMIGRLNDNLESFLAQKRPVVRDGTRAASASTPMRRPKKSEMRLQKRAQ